MDLAAKKEEIGLVLSAPDVDLWKLRELCLTEGGLVDDTLRQRAWPKLVGLHGSDSQEKTLSSSERAGRSRVPRPPPAGFQFEGINKVDDTVKEEDLQNKNRIVECVDADQIDRDVARCTWHLLTGSQRSRRLQMENKHRKKVSKILQRKQVRLSNFINLTLVQANATLSEEEQLRYYQGFHDVASVFLSSLGGGGSGPIPSNASPLEMIASSMGLNLPSRVLGQVAKSHFRDAMRSNFMQLQSALRLVLFPLLARFDPEVHAHLYYCDMEPFFALSWVITWFSHDIRDTGLVKRLFDAFIVSHPLFPLYLSAAMILHPVNRSEILATDCDFASVHQTLAGLPKNSSMVGWKFKVTDGYISGDEGSTASTDMDSTFLSEELLDLMDGESVSTGISLSGAVGSNRVRVPFQELIDTALSYMRRIPPRKLMGLAKRYFAEDPTRELLFEQAKTISLLQPPPSWGLVATTPADWVLKQRLRESRGMKSTNRRDRRRSRSRSRTRSEEKAPADINDIEEIAKYLDEKQRTLAVIASGYGPGDDEEERRRKRRKMLMWGAVAVALVAVSYAVVTQYRAVGTATPSLDTAGAKSTGTIERDLLETNERPNKTVHREQSSRMDNTAKVNSSAERPAQSQRDTDSGCRTTVEYEVIPRGFVESVPLAKEAEPSSAPRPLASNAHEGMASVSRMSSSSKSHAGKIDLSKYSATRGRTSESVVPGPVRYVKRLLLPRAQWAQGIYDDVRQAVNDLDPDLVLPGISLVPNFLSRARQAILGGGGPQLVKDSIIDTSGRGKHLVRDSLRILRRRGSLALKSAGRALAENDAEIVVL